MSDNTAIEWADATVNAVNGCSVLSPGCTNCYAMKLAGTRLRNHPSRTGLTIDSKAGAVWTGEVRMSETALLQPLHWKRPRRIFWNAHGDLFHENVPDDWIDRVFAVCALTPRHTHMILTKRTERMREYFEGCLTDPTWRGDQLFGGWWRGPSIARAMAALKAASGCGGGFVQALPLPNVWLGTSVEDQARADERIPHLLATPAAKRFLSCEPLLGPVDLTMIQFPNGRGKMECWDALDLHLIDNEPMPAGNCDATLDWVIVGGESGPGARPMHPDWARSLRDQCAAAGVPFFFKQWGEWWPHPSGEAVTIRQYHNSIGYIDRDAGSRKRNPNRHTDETMRRVGKKAAGRLLDGVEHSAFPA